MMSASFHLRDQKPGEKSRLLKPVDLDLTVFFLGVFFAMAAKDKSM